MKKEKIINLLLFVLIFLSIFSIVILNPVSDLDELWNYNFARNVANGLVPYKDFNMIITPLMSFICGLILKITVDELIVMRVLAALLCTSILYITYKIFNELDIKKEISIIFIFLIGCLFKDVFCIDYNYGSLLVALIIILLEIKFHKEDNTFIKVNLKQDIILGILAGLSITIKQTTGLLICIALLGNKLLFVRKRDELNVYLKSFFYRFIGIIISVLLMIIYLVLNNAFSDFVSYTILGITEFTNSISYKSLISWSLLGLLSILVPIAFIYGWIKSVVFEKHREIYLLTIYGLATFVICFPISNKIHFLIGALPIIILILYETYNLLKRIRFKISSNEKRFILLAVNFVIILFIIGYSFINLNKYISASEEYSNLNHFRYIKISKGLEEHIERIDKYIVENKNVKILDSSAAVYMIPIDRYNKDYDMFNKGNFGVEGEERIIQQISKSKDIKYLILSDKYPRNWQTPVDIIEYIKENKTKIGTIDSFDIYE